MYAIDVVSFPGPVDRYSILWSQILYILYLTELAWWLRDPTEPLSADSMRIGSFVFFQNFLWKLWGKYLFKKNGWMLYI